MFSFHAVVTRKKRQEAHTDVDRNACSTHTLKQWFWLLFGCSIVTPLTIPMLSYSLSFCLSLDAKAPADGGVQTLRRVREASSHR